jgi:hypothetical protein
MMGNTEVMTRMAVEADIPQLAGLGLKFHAMAQHPGRVPYCNKSAEATLRGMLADPMCLLLVHATGHGMGDPLDGMIGVRLAPVPYNLAKTWAQEVFWWAEGGAGLTLLRGALRWAKAQEASAFMLSVLEVSDPRLRTVLMRMGFERIENCLGVAL